MKKLKTYKTFEGVDINAEDKIDKILENLLKKKYLISMLGETINHVCTVIEKTLPPKLEEFMMDLQHYDDEIFESMEQIREKMIDGLPNLKDTIEDIEKEFESIEEYIKILKGK